MKNLLKFETVQDFTSAYTGNPDAIPTPVPGVAYVRENRKVKYNLHEGVSIRDYRGREMMFISKHEDGTPFNITLSMYEQLSGSTPTEGTSGDYLDFWLEVDKNIVDVENSGQQGLDIPYGSGEKLKVYIPASWRGRVSGSLFNIDFSWGQDTPRPTFPDYLLQFMEGVIASGNAVITARKVWGRYEI